MTKNDQESSQYASTKVYPHQAQSGKSVQADHPAGKPSRL